MPTYKYRCIGRGTTDSQGIAHITHDCEGNALQTQGYTGVGAGIMDFIASTDSPSNISDNSFQSSVHEVIDALYYDKCNTDTSARYRTHSDNTIALDGSSLKLTIGNATNSNKYAILDTNYSYATLSDYTGKTVRLKVDVNPSNEVRVRIRQSVGGQLIDADSLYTTSSSTITVDAEIDPNATRIYFGLYADSSNNPAGSTVTFNNFTIYPI